MPYTSEPPKPPRAARGPRAWLALACSGLLLSLLTTPPPSFSQAQAGQQQQQKPAPAPQEEILDEDDVLRIDTDLVMVDVTVTDAEGRPVRGLRAEDFKLYEDEEERAIAFVNVERRGGAERPVAVVFAVDVSGSMTSDEMVRLQSALGVFSQKVAERPATFALMSFGTSAKIHQQFTESRDKLSRSFERLMREANGLSTHTYDAVDDAIRLLTRHAPRTRARQLLKRAVVVVTDGFPVGDTVSPGTVIERANAAGVSVYTVTLPSFSRLLASAGKKRAPLPTPLDVSGLAEKTGGSNFYADSDDFDPLFRALAEEVTSTYVLAFYPPEEKRRDGRLHTIRVEAPRGLHLRQNRSVYKSREP
jgi:Ca-activated chloride channel family protein